ECMKPAPGEPVQACRDVGFEDRARWHDAWRGVAMLKAHCHYASSPAEIPTNGKGQLFLGFSPDQTNASQAPPRIVPLGRLMAGASSLPQNSAIRPACDADHRTRS